MTNHGAGGRVSDGLGGGGGGSTESKHADCNAAWRLAGSWELLVPVCRRRERERERERWTTGTAARGTRRTRKVQRAARSLRDSPRGLPRPIRPRASPSRRAGQTDSARARRPPDNSRLQQRRRKRREKRKEAKRCSPLSVQLQHAVGQPGSRSRVRPAKGDGSQPEARRVARGFAGGRQHGCPDPVRPSPEPKADAKSKKTARTRRGPKHGRTGRRKSASRACAQHSQRCMRAADCLMRRRTENKETDGNAGGSGAEALGERPACVQPSPGLTWGLLLWGWAAVWVCGGVWTAVWAEGGGGRLRLAEAVETIDWSARCCCCCPARSPAAALRTAHMLDATPLPRRPSCSSPPDPPG